MISFEMCWLLSIAAAAVAGADVGASAASLCIISFFPSEQDHCSECLDSVIAPPPREESLSVHQMKGLSPLLTALW